VTFEMKVNERKKKVLSTADGKKAGGGGTIPLNHSPNSSAIIITSMQSGNSRSRSSHLFPFLPPCWLSCYPPIPFICSLFSNLESRPSSIPFLPCLIFQFFNPISPDVPCSPQVEKISVCSPFTFAALCAFLSPLG
jgi:hypothetical protein